MRPMRRASSRVGAPAWSPSTATTAAPQALPSASASDFVQSFELPGQVTGAERVSGTDRIDDRDAGDGRDDRPRPVRGE